MAGSLSKFIKRVCAQTAIYWGSPTNNGYGEVYDQPRLVNVRWEDFSEMVMDEKGNQILCKARVMVGEDLEVGGILYLGDFVGVDNEHRTDPLSLDGAYLIKRVEKIPLFGSKDEFVRRVWLG